MITQALKNNYLRLALLALMITGIALFFLLGGHRRFTFERLVENKDALVSLANEHPLYAVTTYVTSYLLLGVFGLPGSTVLNLSAGVLFGFPHGLILVIVASTFASALAFYSFRYLFRDFVEAKVRAKYPRLEDDLRREGAYFVFAMRLFPGIPYSFTNLVLAISPVSFPVYLGVSLLSLLPRYLLYVYAGTHLGDVKNPSDIFSPSMVAVLGLLGIFPWVVKWAAPRIKERLVKPTTLR